MTDSSAEQRTSHSSYSALHGAANGDASKARPSAPANGASTEPDYLTTELERLEFLKQALYAAFIAAPKEGIPVQLVDLAATYTSALRLQLSLNGLRSAVPRSAKAPVFTTARMK